MSYEYFYDGASSSLDPNYGEFIGYRGQFKDLGMTTDPRTANIIQDVLMKLNTGIKVMEIEGVSPEIFDSIPTQHLEEVRRLSELSGAETTLHGPLIEASGFTREGWSETNRESAERQMNQVVERAHDLSPKGNIPVTFHSTAMLPEALETVKQKVEGEYKEVPKGMLIVEPRTGDIKQLKEVEKFFPEEGKQLGEERKFDPERELEKRNRDIWTETLGSLNFSALRGEQELESFKEPEIFKSYAEFKENPESIDKFPEQEKEILQRGFRNLEHGSVFLKDAYRQMRELYNMVYKDASDDDRKKLNSYAKEIAPLVQTGIERDPEKLQHFSEVIQKGLNVLGSLKTPRIYKPLNEFVIEKSSETFANAAFRGYEKFKDSAPIISIENPPAGAGLSRAEDIKRLVEESRKNFVKRAKEEGISESEAKKAAEKLIGATWDVGHINMLRKQGYTKEDIIKQTEKIAPFVKHVHLSDNFGMEHTELPMGMGNVPIKEIMEKLGKEGFKGKKIIEAAQWWQHFKTPPLVPTLEAFGSPLYAMKAAPYWNQISATYGSYFSGYGPIMPEQHFSMYGAGFSGMPVELGGQMPGKQSRFAGTPTE